MIVSSHFSTLFRLNSTNVIRKPKGCVCCSFSVSPSNSFHRCNLPNIGSTTYVKRIIGFTEVLYLIVNSYENCYLSYVYEYSSSENNATVYLFNPSTSEHRIK